MYIDNFEKALAAFTDVFMDNKIGNFEKAMDAFDSKMDKLANKHAQPNDGIEVIYSKSVEKPIGAGDILDDIKQVIFNYPATIVLFKDGSKVCVKAVGKDKFNKEVGLMAAIVKRLYANDIDSKGYMKSSGLGDKIEKLVNNATVQNKKTDDGKKATKDK